MKKEGGIISIGLLSALAASLCCIVPLIAILAGTSSLASMFSWLEPFRPYLIALTFIFLGIAWYSKLKPRKQQDCNCDNVQKEKFLNSRLFLGILTIFISLLISLPTYSHLFYPTTTQQSIVNDNSLLQTVEFEVKGMTCSGCEQHIITEVNQIQGVINSTASYSEGNTVVKFESSKTTIAEIENKINGTGYTVIGINEK